MQGEYLTLSNSDQYPEALNLIVNELNDFKTLQKMKETDEQDEDETVDSDEDES